MYHFLGCSDNILYLDVNSQRCNWSQTRREDNEEISVLFRCERKTPDNYYSRENQRSQEGTENPIHLVPPVWFEPGSHRWKVRQDTHQTTIVGLCTFLKQWRPLKTFIHFTGYVYFSSNKNQLYMVFENTSLFTFLYLFTSLSA